MGEPQPYGKLIDIIPHQKENKNSLAANNKKHLKFMSSLILPEQFTMIMLIVIKTFISLLRYRDKQKFLV